MQTRIDPDIAAAEMRAAGGNPVEPFPGRHKPWLCECLTCGESITPSLHSVRNGRRACRFCGIKRRAEKRRTDHDTAAAEMLAAGFVVLEQYRNAHHPWRVRCTNCGDEVVKRLAGLRQGHINCPACGPNTPVPTAVAQAAAHDAGFTPLEPYPEGTKEPWRLECVTCGRESVKTYGGLAKGDGCAYCSGTRVDPLEARSVMLEAGLVPLVDYPGSHAEWLCRCAVCDKEVAPTFHNISGGATQGCAFCAGRRVDPAEAEAVMLAAGLTPLVPYPGAVAPWLCECQSCGNEVTPRYNNIQQGAGGCSECARGFSELALSVVYLMAHDGFGAVKVGVGNVGNDRVGWHRKEGWTLLALIDTDTGREAKRIERRVLSAWRAAGYPHAVQPQDMPRKGHTETAPDTPDARRLAVEAMFPAA